MIFQRRAKRYDCNFYIGNEKIDIVQNYTYLELKWGLFIKWDYRIYSDTSPIEKGHLQFCKRYLQVNNKAPNIAVPDWNWPISFYLWYK